MYLLHFKFLPRENGIGNILDGTTSGGVVGIADGSAMNGTVWQIGLKFTDTHQTEISMKTQVVAVMVLLSLLEI